MRLRLLDKRPENSDTVTFIFSAPEELSWQAGQFILYRLPHESPDDRGDRRYFTNAAAPYENKVQITTRFNPRGSSFKKALQAFEPGDEIEAKKVAGSFVMDEPQKRHVFIAGGIGITPYRAILKQLDHDEQPMNVTLLYANRTADFVFQKELEEIADRRSGLKIYYFVDPNKIDAQAISQNGPDLQQSTFWLSGPEPMAEAMEGMLSKLGVPEEQIKTDYFPGYEWPEISAPPEPKSQPL